jgi:hypothetical protein
MCARLRSNFLLLRQNRVIKEKASRIRRPSPPHNGPEVKHPSFCQVRAAARRVGWPSLWRGLNPDVECDPLLTEMLCFISHINKVSMKPAAAQRPVPVVAFLM